MDIHGLHEEKALFKLLANSFYENMNAHGFGIRAHAEAYGSLLDSEEQ